MPTGHTTTIQRCLVQLRENHPEARNQLILLTRDRLLGMIRGLMMRYPHLRRWEDSEDVFQNVQIRLCRCLDQVSIESVQDFLCLAATNMRRELIDLCRHHFGEDAYGNNHATPNNQLEGIADLDQHQTGGDCDPSILAEWAELHELIAQLPEDEKCVVDLHWYHGLSQPETAELLGISLKTVKRRWLSAKARLAGRLQNITFADQVEN
jgi:RNA polymerase sigma factor (sigma-70 family)